MLFSKHCGAIGEDKIQVHVKKPVVISFRLMVALRNVLNITNGDSAVGIMMQAKIPGEFLPWRDVLHDGPVPDGFSLEKLSEIRAKFIIDQNWGNPEVIKRHFTERDITLKSFEKSEKIILWFEHDLYDQLQLLQILDWFHQNRSHKTTLFIICVDQYLGECSSNEMETLYTDAKPITNNHLLLANNAWTAFRSDSPEKWHALLKIDTTALPYLAGAVIRLLEEYPGRQNGLSRTAQQALEIIAQGEKCPANVFERNQESEERKFLGNSSFWTILHELLASSPPLLKLSSGQKLISPVGPNQQLTLTTEGKKVLSGEMNWLNIATIDRWIGGVHLTPDSRWCWDSHAKMMVRHG